MEGLCYLCSENKGADQLRGFREADLRLCFRICQNPVFSVAAHFTFEYIWFKDCCAGWGYSFNKRQ